MESVKAFKRKMLLWINNWSQEDLQQSTEQVPFTPDAMEIGSLLRAVGFRMRFMDRCLPTEMHPVPGVPAGHPACRVIIMCPRSGIRMELDAETSSCRCPSTDKSDFGDKWAITDPFSEEMSRAVESLGPKLSGDMSRTISQLVEGLFQVLRLLPDVNQNDITDTAYSKTLEKTEIQQSNNPSTTSTSSSNSPMKTPATAGIAVVTPNAPCVPKASPGDSKTAIPGRYRSLDTLIAFGSFPDDLPEPGQLTPKDDGKPAPDTGMEVDGELDTTIIQGSGSASKKVTIGVQDLRGNERGFFHSEYSVPSFSAKKQSDQRVLRSSDSENQGKVLQIMTFISKSSPAVNSTENFQRSTTFVFEDDGEEGKPEAKETGNKQQLLRSDTFVSDGTTNNGEENPRMGPAPRRTPSPLITSKSVHPIDILSKLQEIQLALGDVIFELAGSGKNISNIGDVSKASKAAVIQKIISDNTIRPIRCLSDFGSVPNLARTTTTVRSIPRPNTRRSSSLATPATPTTSRRVVSTSAVDRIKKVPTASSSIKTPTSNRSSLAPSGNTQQKNFSTTSKKTDAISNSFSPNRRAVNNCDKKYSNLQSSIPKPGPNARK